MYPMLLNLLVAAAYLALFTAPMFLAIRAMDGEPDEGVDRKRSDAR